MDTYRGSRSAELRHARSEMAKARAAFKSGSTATAADYEDEDERKPNEVPFAEGITGNYNIHEMLANNIQESGYYKSLKGMKEFNAMVDEIYNKCDHAGRVYT
jgi:hypothetical protein